MYLLRISFALSLLWSTQAAFNGNPSVCQPLTPGPNDPPRPNMTYPTFSAKVEANIVNKHYTAVFEEHYDSINKLASVKREVAGSRTHVIYNFPTNELYSVDQDSKHCDVYDLANSSGLYLFGQPVNGKDQAMMLSAAGALRFSKDIPAKHINVTTIRGIPCDLWRSCLFWSARQTTFVLDWYFSVNGSITTQGLYQVPIRAHIKGAVANTSSGLNSTFEHYYNFMDFRTDVSAKQFQTPEGAYCPGRKLTKPLPTPAQAFHFTSEILDVNSQNIGRIKEWYDYNLKLVRFDLTQMVPSGYGQYPLTQIHDFTTGVAYIIDNYHGNCSITSISKAGFDVRNADPTHVRLRNAKEFFYFDQTKYNYEGQKMARGILCDVWITQRNDWPTQGSSISTWEWYFATKNYTADLPDVPSFGLPIMLEMTSSINKFPIHYIYNIYSYDEQRPVVWDYNIGQCFDSSHRQDYNFVLPGSFRTTVDANMDAFKYAVLNAIKSAGGGISPLRITNIQVDYADNNDILVYFTLLDRPPAIGDVVNPTQEADLGTVAQNLNTAINGKNLIVTVTPPNGQPVRMTARQNTLTQASKTIQITHYGKSQPGQVKKTGYSGGVMAGMGVALVVVFFVLGVVGMFLFKRRQGGPIPSVKFDNQKDKEDITQDFS